MKKPRKPKRLDRHGKSRNLKVYAAFDETEGCCVYIGGRHYEDTAQIHLNALEVLALSKWLTKAAAYISGQERTDE